MSDKLESKSQTKDCKKPLKTQKGLKFYQIALICASLSFLLLPAQNIYTEKRNEWISKLLMSPPKDFRNLEIDVNAAATNACNRGTEELRNYYLGKAEMEYTVELSEEEPTEPIQAIINIIDGGFSVDEALKYVKHTIPSLAFIALAILTLPLWLVCCFCCCCNCCCCCCCKKKPFKYICFFTAIAMYAVVFVCCIYGFSQSKSLFEGLGDATCTVLRFIGEVLNGETRQEKPRWIGANGVTTLLDDIKTTVNELIADTKQNLNSLYAEFGTRTTDMENFVNQQGPESDLKSSVFKFKTDQHLPTPPDSGTDFTYTQTSDKSTIVDVAYAYDNTEQSYISVMKTTFEVVKKAGKEALDFAKNNFNLIFESDGSGNNKIDSILAEAEGTINDIQNTINSLSDAVAESVDDYSQKVDDYGKLGFKVAFGVLFAINAFSAVCLVLYIIVQCSGAIACFVKVFIHIFWNLSTLLTFVTLLLGGIFMLLGTVGKDAVDLVSFLLSKGNINSQNPSILDIGDAKEYLIVCLHEDGDLAKKLKFADEGAMNSINELNDQLGFIKNNKTLVEDNLKKLTIYEEVTKKLKAKANDFTDLTTGVAKFPDGGSMEGILTLEGYISLLNKCQGGTHTDYKMTVPTGGSGTSLQALYDGSTDLDSYGVTNCEKFYLKVIRDIYKNLKSLYSDPITSDEVEVTCGATSTLQCFFDRGNYLMNQMTDTELKTFDLFITAIGKLLESFGDVLTGKSGESGGIYSFLNCRFIGNNAKIILKYLKNGFGNKFYGVGVALSISGLSMGFSVFITILSISIIKAITDQANPNANANTNQSGTKKSVGPQKYRPRRISQLSQVGQTPANSEAFGLKPK